jgi:hypothetical protein
MPINISREEAVKLGIALAIGAGIGYSVSKITSKKHESAEKVRRNVKIFSRVTEIDDKEKLTFFLLFHCFFVCVRCFLCDSSVFL